MNAIDIRTALLVIAAEIERGNHRSAADKVAALVSALPPATVGELLATHLEAIRSRDVVIECFDDELFSQISYEESVIDDLRGGEHHQTVHNYYAERTFDAGQWSDTEPLYDVDMIADRLNHPARIVAVGHDQADADPATRGPIGGGR